MQLPLPWQIEPEQRLTGLCDIAFASAVYNLARVQRCGTDLIPYTTFHTHTVLGPLGAALIIAMSHNIGALIATSNVTAAVIFQKPQRIACAHTILATNAMPPTHNHTLTHTCASKSEQYFLVHYSKVPFHALRNASIYVCMYVWMCVCVFVLVSITGPPTYSALLYIFTIDISTHEYT